MTASAWLQQIKNFALCLCGYSHKHNYARYLWCFVTPKMGAQQESVQKTPAPAPGLARQRAKPSRRPE